MKQVVFIVSLMLTWFSTLGQVGMKSKKWVLVWNDEFHYFNETIWTKKDNFDHYGERQVYVAKNAYVENGNLVIETKAEQYGCPYWALDPDWHCVKQYREASPYEYTSAWVESNKRFDTQFGFIEARIQFPYQRALLPAFWTFRGGSAKHFSNAAEIDIAEMLGTMGENTITMNIHKDYCTPDKESYEKGCPEIGNYFKVVNTIKGYRWQDWHVYGLEWNKKKIRFYVDGKRIHTIKKHGIVDPVALIFNTAVNRDEEVNDSLMPQKLLVDYVRVYKEK